MEQEKTVTGCGLSAVESQIMHLMSSDHHLPKLLCLFCLADAANLGDEKGKLP